MSLDDLKSLAMEFASRAAARLGARVYAVWLSGGVARGDFIKNVSDLDTELILKIGEETKRTAYDMSELADLCKEFRGRAAKLRATEFDCFVFRLNDLKPKFHILDLALHGEAMWGPAPAEVFSVERMRKNQCELAMEFVHEAARNARDVLGGTSRAEFGIASSVKLVMETPHAPALLWNAREVPKAANLVTGQSVSTKPECFQVFRDSFPIYRDLVNEIWQYKLDQNRLRIRKETYVEDFLRRCLYFTVDMEKRLAEVWRKQDRERNERQPDVGKSRPDTGV